MIKFLQHILFFLLLVAVSNELSNAQINSNKVYYFYYSTKDNTTPAKYVWIYNDTSNSSHQFTSYSGKENQDLLKNATYLGSGFIDEVIIKDGVFYFKCSRFRQYCDFKKLTNSP